MGRMLLTSSQDGATNGIEVSIVKPQMVLPRVIGNRMRISIGGSYEKAQRTLE